MKTSFLLLIFSVLNIFSLTAQKRFSEDKPLVVIKIDQISLNGNDASVHFRNENQHLSICKTMDGHLYMKNEGMNEGSYGDITNLNIADIDAEFLNGKILSFNWNYMNSYDDSEGCAAVDMVITKRKDDYYADVTITYDQNIIRINGMIVRESE